MCAAQHWLLRGPPAASPSLSAVFLPSRSGGAPRGPSRQRPLRKFPHQAAAPMQLTGSSKGHITWSALRCQPGAEPGAWKSLGGQRQWAAFGLASSHTQNRVHGSPGANLEPGRPEHGPQVPSRHSGTSAVSRSWGAPKLEPSAAFLCLLGSFPLGGFGRQGKTGDRHQSLGLVLVSLTTSVEFSKFSRACPPAPRLVGSGGFCRSQLRILASGEPERVQILGGSPGNANSPTFGLRGCARTYPPTHTHAPHASPRNTASMAAGPQGV